MEEHKQDTKQQFIDEIKTLIANRPKHYSILIRSNVKLYNWVIENSLCTSSHFPDMIYSAINNESNICPHNKILSISRINDGWKKCGPAAKCECTKTCIANGVSATKQAYSKIRKKEINDTRKETNQRLHGVDYVVERADVRAKISAPKIKKEIYEKLTNFEWLNEEYNNKKRTLVDIADELKVYYSTVGEYCKKFNFKIRQRSNYSLEEKIVSRMLDEIGIVHESSNWDIIPSKEIDIYVPSCKFGIEVNGLHWHSYSPYCKHSNEIENRFRHVEKTEMAYKNGVNLIHITDIF